MTRSKIIFTLAVISVVLVLGIWVRSKTDTEALVGLDSNHDGVRDDVEKFINSTYSNEKVGIAAKEFHRSMQEAILSPEHWDSYREDLASDCLYYLDSENAYRIIKEVEAQTANTRARIAAYWKANATLSGTMVPAINPRIEACSFGKRLFEGK